MISWNSLAPWQRLASEKQQAYSFFYIWEPKKRISAHVKSSKRLRCHANTNRITSLHKILWTRNPGRVVKTAAWQQKKGWKLAGSLRAAWPCLLFVVSCLLFVVCCWLLLFWLWLWWWWWWLLLLSLLSSSCLLVLLLLLLVLGGVGNRKLLFPGTLHLAVGGVGGLIITNSSHSEPMVVHGAVDFHPCHATLHVAPA